MQECWICIVCMTFLVLTSDVGSFFWLKIFGMTFLLVLASDVGSFFWVEIFGMTFLLVLASNVGAFFWAIFITFDSVANFQSMTKGCNTK